MEKILPTVGMYHFHCLVLPAKVSPPIGQLSGTWDTQSYWYYPWGESVVHKGIDFFDEKHSAVLAPVSGFVVKTASTGNGGNVVYILGPR